MREGSNFKGSEQDLVLSIKKYLPLFTSNTSWLDNIKDSITEDEYIDICETIAECVDRGYINDTKYKVTMNNHIHFLNKTVYIGKVPEDAIKPFTLSDEGANFLES